MRKITLLFFSLLLSASLIIPSRTQTVSAYTAQDSGYWVGMVKSSSNVTMVGTVDSYSAGVTLMNKQKSTSSNVATLFKGSKIVACKYATLDFTAVGSSSVNSYIYAQKTDGTYNSTADYFNGFYTAEGPYIVTGSTSSKAVTVISGLRGRVNKTRNDNTQYEIVPISVAEPLNYYVADANGNLRHYFAYFSSQSSLNIGVAPEFMEAGKKYYSYDGHYFYTKYTDLIDDLEKSVSTHAVNADAPWFNYYQFLPFHSTTNYTAGDIDSYLRAKGYTQLAYTYYSTAQNGESTYPLSNQSLLYGSGSYFMQMQQIYGINPLLLLSISANESSWGRSYISIVKNNLFGMAAYDSSTSSATAYDCPLDSILDVAKVLTSGYFNAASDANYYYGAILGNKEAGVNVKYASDAYWGEKAAAHYYAIDKYLGFKDYNSYTIGVTNKEGVKAYKTAATTTVSYVMNGVGRVLKNNAVLICGEEGDYYKVMADYSLSAAKDWTEGEFTTKYDLENNYVYVKKSNITVINTSKGNIPLNSEELNSLRVEYLDEYYTLEANVQTNIYYDIYKQAAWNSTIAQGARLVATERAYNNDGDVMYKVIVNQTNGKTGWVKASDCKEITGSYAIKYNKTHDATAVKVYETYNTDNQVSTVKYNNQAVAILSTKTVNDVKWYKICYAPATNSVGWVKASGFKTAVKHTAPEPTQPEEPVDPVDPADPVEPVDPTDPVDPVNPVDPTDPVTPTDPVNPTDPVTPTDPIVPDVPDFSTKEKKSGMYYLHKIELNEDKNMLIIQGLLAIEGIKNASDTAIQFYLECTNQQTNEKYYIPMDRWTNTSEFPYNVNDVPGVKKDYSGAWFEGYVDFGVLPSGDYSVNLLNVQEKYYCRQVFSNPYSVTMNQRFTNLVGAGVELRTNFMLKTLPIDVFIRQNGLLCAEEKSTFDNAFVEYSSLSLENGKLSIKGTAFSIGGDYPKDATVKRTLVLENIESFERKTYDIGSTTKGDYKVTLRVDDHLSKTRAWYDASVDISSLPEGTYAMYIVTTDNKNFTDYGELADPFFRDIQTTMTVNKKVYTVTYNEKKRNRLELTITAQ